MSSIEESPTGGEAARRGSRQDCRRRPRSLVRIPGSYPNSAVHTIGADRERRRRDLLERTAAYLRFEGARAEAFKSQARLVAGELDWAWCARDAAVLPLAGIPGDDEKERRIQEEYEARKKAALARLRPWLAEYCTVLAETGLRPSELLGVLGLDVRDKLVSIVPWEGRQLKSKWSKRTIEVNEVAAEILKRRKETMFAKTAPIFSNRLGDVYGENSVYRLFCSEHAVPGPQHMAIEALAAYIGHSPASTQTLLRWYTDQNALRRGAPVPLVGEQKEGKVIAIGK